MLRFTALLVALALSAILVSGEPRKVKFRKRLDCRYHCAVRPGSEVCGSDGKTYSSHCSLKKASCNSTTWIHVVHRGVCRSSTTGQRKCMMLCVKIYQPVCGDDGKTYGNQCLLNSTSCRSGVPIRKVHNGKCTELCSRRRCRGRPKEPVCGNDGRTYSTACALKFHACKSKTNITLVHRGQCTESCQIKACRRNLAYLCGSDGKTYTNLCELKNEACSTRVKIGIAHRGKCDDDSQGCIKKCNKRRRPVCGSDGVTYGNNCLLEIAVCIAQKKGKQLTKTTCSKPDLCRKMSCERKIKHVCGNDGKTYLNECVMNSTACRKKKEIKIAHHGRCIEKCQIRPCIRILRPVCGSDGKTYNNMCQLKNEACHSRKQIKAIARKRCEDLNCTTKACPRIRKPVCASDGKQYQNKCMMENAACASGSVLTVVKEGKCDKSRKCRQRCPKFNAPLCGSDGKTYKNLCFMRQASCQEEKRIIAAKGGICKV